MIAHFTHAFHQCMSEISLSAKYQAMFSPQTCLLPHGQGVLVHVHVCLVHLGRHSVAGPVHVHQVEWEGHPAAGQAHPVEWDGHSYVARGKGMRASNRVIFFHLPL